MPYKFVKIGKSGMPYFYEFDTDTFLLDLLDIKLSSFLGIFVVRILKSIGRHGIGKKVRLGYQFG